MVITQSMNGARRTIFTAQEQRTRDIADRSTERDATHKEWGAD